MKPPYRSAFGSCLRVQPKCSKVPPTRSILPPSATAIVSTTPWRLSVLVAAFLMKEPP